MLVFSQCLTLSEVAGTFHVFCNVYTAALPDLLIALCVFLLKQIDGEAFLLMTQSDIVKIMSIKLGPALKIFNSILMFKAAEKNSHNEL